MTAQFMHWLRHPRLAAARLRYWCWERRNPDKPWLCPDTVRFCERTLMRTMKGLEFGSGRSTLWFAKRLKSLTSIEHDSEWYREVSDLLQRERVGNVDYRFIALDHPLSEPERLEYDPIPHYVDVLEQSADESFDFIVVDGHYRTTCIKRAVAKLAPLGLLLVDDVNIWPSRASVPVPVEWELANESTNGLKRCCIWRKPKRRGLLQSKQELRV